MEFLLGIFTGIASMIFLGIWLNEREKKRKQQEHENAVRDLNSFLGWLRPKGNEPFIKHPDSLDEQLRDAIYREDFKEAAHLRDLMNKK